MSQTVETDSLCDTYLSCLLFVFHEMTKLPSVNFGAEVVESAVGTHAARAGTAARARRSGSFMGFPVVVGLKVDRENKGGVKRPNGERPVA